MPISVEDFSPAETYDEALSRAAGAWGVQPEYWDIWGKRHTAGADLQRTVLSSMGFEADTIHQLNAAIQKRAGFDWAVFAPPTMVVCLSEGSVPLNVPDELADAEIEAEFRWEDGRSHRSQFHLERLHPESKNTVNGRSFTRRNLPIPAGAPLGYHKLLVRGGGQSSESRLILCPDRAFEPDFLASGGLGAGVAVSVYGLRSDRNWGCGDFTDLRRFCDWASDRAGASFVALNPLHSIPNRQPYNTSPYLPNCSFYRNSLYLDVEAIGDVQRSPLARKLLASDKVRQCFASLRGSEYVEYEKVHSLKLKFLKLGYRQFRSGPGSEAFQNFVRSEGGLLDKYAVYCALDEVLHKRDRNVWIWRDWPSEYQEPDSTAIAAFRNEFPRLIEFYKWVQWHVDQQLAAAQRHAREKGLPIGLYHDLALATDGWGSDLWAHRPFYVAGCRVGAPPDDFSPKGQDWGFPPPNSLRHKLDGYRLFAESIRKNCKHGGALRIDHVMRFFRLFWIPEGKDATEGAYVLDYWEDLVRILALESVRNQVVVIGEDLGTVEPYIREALQRFGVLSYRLLYFEKAGSEFRGPEEYPRDALVSVSTHDLPTLAGFWTNKDIEARRQAGVLPDEASYRSQLQDRLQEKQKMLNLFHRYRLLPEWFSKRVEDTPEFSGELHYAAVGFLAQTPSKLMVLNQEDLFKDMDQQNLPGTTEQYPNWRHKMRFSVDEVWSEPLAEACTNMFRRWLERTGRLTTV